MFVCTGFIRVLILNANSIDRLDIHLCPCTPVTVAPVLRAHVQRYIAFSNTKSMLHHSRQCCRFVSRKMSVVYERKWGGVAEVKSFLTLDSPVVLVDARFKTHYPPVTSEKRLHSTCWTSAVRTPVECTGMCHAGAQRFSGAKDHFRRNSEVRGASGSSERLLRRGRTEREVQETHFFCPTNREKHELS